MPNSQRRWSPRTRHTVYLVIFCLGAYLIERLAESQWQVPKGMLYWVFITALGLTIAAIFIKGRSG